MRTETPQTIRRADYQPLAWTVTDVDLHFALDPAATIVTSRLTLKRNPKAPAGPLVLLGDELELVSLKIDGYEPAAPRITDTRIEIDLEDDSATAEIVTRIAPERNTALSGLYTRAAAFHAMRGRGLPSHHLVPGPPGCDGLLHGHAGCGQDEIPGAAFERQPDRPG